MKQLLILVLGVTVISSYQRRIMIVYMPVKHDGLGLNPSAGAIRQRGVNYMLLNIILGLLIATLLVVLSFCLMMIRSRTG